MAPTTPNFAIHFAVGPDAEGGYICDATSPANKPRLLTRFRGQTANHAIAIALENLAQAFRENVQTEQDIDWDAVDRSDSGEVVDKHFHVIVHYECVVADESKFEAMVGTQMGNTIVENAEFTLIQVDPSLSIKPLERERRET